MSGASKSAGAAAWEKPVGGAQSLLALDGSEEYPVQGRTLVFQNNDFVRLEGARPGMTGTFGIKRSKEVWQLDLSVKSREAWKEKVILMIVYREY